MEYETKLKWARKLTAIEEKGGVCQKCGKSLLDNPWLSDFHHVEGKDHEMSKMMQSTWSKLEKELSKCILLCCECHRNEHFNSSELFDSMEDIRVYMETIKEGKTEITRDEVNKVLSLHKEGKTNSQIAKECNRDRKRVGEILKENGLTSNGYGHNGIGKEKEDIIQKMIEEGYTGGEISLATGIKPATIYMKAKRKGWKFKRAQGQH